MCEIKDFIILADFNSILFFMSHLKKIKMWLKSTLWVWFTKLGVKFYYPVSEHLVILINFLLLIRVYNDSFLFPALAKYVRLVLLARDVSMAIKKIWLWIKEQKQCANQEMEDEVMPLTVTITFNFSVVL